jgi:hypothetical protein
MANTIRVFTTRELTPELWRSFVERAHRDGVSPTTALARLLRRYLARGFEHDDDEKHDG